MSFLGLRFGGKSRMRNKWHGLSNNRTNCRKTVKKARNEKAYDGGGMLELKVCRSRKRVERCEMDTKRVYLMVYERLCMGSPRTDRHTWEDQTSWIMNILRGEFSPFFLRKETGVPFIGHFLGRATILLPYIEIFFGPQEEGNFPPIYRNFIEIMRESVW